MGDAIGQLSFQQDAGQEQMYRMHSEATAQKIDDACRSLVDEAYQRTVNLLTEKKHLVQALGDKLLELEQLGHDEIVSVLGPRPFANDSYVKFLENTREFAQKYGEEEIKEKTVKDDRKSILETEEEPKPSEGEETKADEKGSS